MVWKEDRGVLLHDVPTKPEQIQIGSELFDQG